MNGRTRANLYPQITKKQGGEYCAGCGVSPENTTEGILLIDHIDNNNSNNRLENLELMCRACNRIKNPSKTFKPSLVKTQSETTNQRVEIKWREWVMSKVINGGGYWIDEIINSGAELFDCSPETISRRYLPKLTSAAGLFVERKGVLYLKSHEVKN